jgi:hypothetical protein
VDLSLVYGVGFPRSVWSARSLLPLWTALVCDSGSKLRVIQTLPRGSEPWHLPDDDGPHRTAGLNNGRPLGVPNLPTPLPQN